ncbi:hypothetical protein [Ornithinimicrobium avium]|uniref:Uncharacterized protein n=1 Tax=Ornithinimicrobium avium TaxID=2283195 RepID=A0A345NL34_9MICO|nr:hypothetical protein [Ornithinimicrobium avium]AXH95742.1 hypothetical protein DV701_06025 [Ornithinimicrobium avium]
MGDRGDRDADIRRQRLAVAIAVGMAIGLALSLATDRWSMIAVGLVLGLALGLSYRVTGGPGDFRRAGRGNAV